MAMDKNEPEIKSTQMLRDAILDSELLLSHSSENGIAIDAKFIKAIVNAKKNEQKNSWTEQDEIDFWVAFQFLSKAVQPVSIDSLRAAAEPKAYVPNLWQRITFQKKKSRVERSVSWYRRLALFFMIIMLALQIYGIIGASLMAKVTSGNERMIEIEKRMQELILITSTNIEDRTADMEKTHIETENIELGQEVESSIELLGDWLKFTGNLWSRSVKEISKSVKGKARADSPDNTSFPGADDTSNNIVVVQQAKSLIIILNQYILPLLYGLLGGFAFVLRNIADETKKMTYTPTSDIKFGLRIHLGALAGLVIGFLWGDFQGKSFGLVESLSPLAVAFIAGYSVDFLFRLLDSLIGNITNKEAAPAEQTANKKQ
jgi:hypothetical protein